MAVLSPCQLNHWKAAVGTTAWTYMKSRNILFLFIFFYGKMSSATSVFQLCLTFYPKVHNTEILTFFNRPNLSLKSLPVHYAGSTELPIWKTSPTLINRTKRTLETIE